MNTADLTLTTRNHSHHPLAPERICCNNVIFAHEFNPHRVRLWLIGHAHGAVCAVWAENEQDALDEMVDLGMGSCFEKEDAAPGGIGDEENGDIQYAGNHSTPCDFSDMWIDEVVMDPKRDIQLLLRLAEARGMNSTTLEGV